MCKIANFYVCESIFKVTYFSQYVNEYLRTKCENYMRSHPFLLYSLYFISEVNTIHMNT